MKKQTKRMLMLALGAAAMAVACAAFSSCGHEHCWGDWTVVRQGSCTTRTIEQRICLEDPSHVEERGLFFYHEYDENDVCSLCGEWKESEGLAFELAGDGTYRVAGIGECRDTSIILPKEYKGVAVTAVKNGAFMGNFSLTYVKIPDSIVRVGDSAFNGCTSLRQVDFGANVAQIGTSAFNGCIALQSISLPQGVKTVGRRAFFECSAIVNADMGGGQAVSDEAFAACSALQTVTFGQDILSIGNEAFSDCGELTNLSFGNQLQSIGEAAFRKCGKLTAVSFPETLSKVGAYAFRECVSLQEVSIPASLKSVPLAAFRGCAALERVTIAEGVETIGNDAFRDCALLQSIVLPASVSALGDGAFAYCVKLEWMAFGAVKAVKPSAFENCYVLQTVFFRGSPEEWDNSVLSSMSTLEDVTAFFYSETQPDATQTYWHFVGGVPTIW